MLSAANSPDPPCTSSKSPTLNSDEKGHPSERPSSSSEADPADGLVEAYHPHFCIRDYVFASRSKGVGANWPFPQQYLQLCLKHGIRDLLPPFEPPDLVRARLSEADHLMLCSEVLDGLQTEVSDAVKNDYSSPTQESVLDSSHQHQNPSSENKSAAVQAVSCSEDRLLLGEAEPKVTRYDHIAIVPSSDSCRFPGSVQESPSTISEPLSEVEVAKPPRATENLRGPSERPVKKCKLIVKFGGDLQPKRSEDIVSNFSSVTDPMATKVCPVCKIFSSTSNTTLNAHIDQCLSAESSAKDNTTMLAQHKVKPRKKRSMEEIYATAPRCTIEDLDRRNGTNWASDLASMAQKNEISCTTESKQPRISPLADDTRKRVVYVDSNGTKLLILSNFNDVQSAAAVDSSGPQKCTKKSKNRSSPFGKRKCFPPRYRKYLKANVQRKKMSSFSHLKGEIHKERKLHADNTCEEGRIPQASNAPEQTKVGRPGTLGHWICSKRSSLLKHLNNLSSNRKPRNPLAIENHRSVESNQSTSCDYLAVGGHSQKFCKSSDKNLTPSKIRSTDVLSDAVHTSLNQGKHSANSPEKNSRSIRNNHSTSSHIMQKLSQSSEKCVSSVKGKSGEIHANAVQKSAKFQSLRKASVHCHPQAHKPEKGPRRSFLMDGQQHSLDTMKCREIMQGVICKNIWKHKFAERPHKPIKESPVELAEGFHGSPSIHGLDSTSNTLTAGMQQSNFSENVWRPEMSNTFDHVSPHQGNTTDSDQADVYNNASEYGDFFTSNQTQLEAEYHHVGGMELDALAEVPASMDSMTKCPLEKSFGTCGSKIVTSEDLETTVCEILDTCLSHEYERELNSANEATTEASIPKLVGDQGIPPGVSASDVVQQDIWQAGQIESHVQDGYCSVLQNMKNQEDVASTQDPGACLTRPEDKFLELSSATSGRSGPAEIHNMIVDGEPSGSPVSASSTISHLSVEDLKSKDGEQEPLEEPVVIQEKLWSECGNLRLPLYDNMRGTGRTNLEKKFQKFPAITSAQDPEKFWNSQPCCCSQRERVPIKSRTLRQDAISGMMLPTNSPLYIRPVVSSSGAYSHSTSELTAIPIPILDAPADSMFVKACPDFSMGFPTFGCFGSASPPSHIRPSNNSSPILRLMGKNLMVMKKDEAPGQQQNQSSPCPHENTSNGKYMSLPGFSSTCSFSNVDAIQYHPHPSLEGSTFSVQRPSNIQVSIPLAAERTACYTGTLLQSVEMIQTDSHPHHKMLGKKLNLSATYNRGTVWTPHESQTPIPATKAPIQGREIIVIEDSPEYENEHSGSLQHPSSNIGAPFPGSEIRHFRSFSCYPSPNAVQPRDLGCVPKPGFSSFMPEA